MIVSMNWNGRILYKYYTGTCKYYNINSYDTKKNIVCKYHFLIIFQCKSP